MNQITTKSTVQPRKKLGLKNTLGFIASFGTFAFILSSKYVIQSTTTELARETAIEFLSMYLFFVCGLAMITIFGFLAKNKLLWINTLWILMYSIVVFLGTSASKTSNIALIAVPPLIVLSTIVLGRFNKQKAVVTEGLLLLAVWFFFFLLMKIF